MDINKELEKVLNHIDDSIYRKRILTSSDYLYSDAKSELCIEIQEMEIIKEELEYIIKEYNSKPMDDNFDNVENPEHYTTGEYECIEVMKDVYGLEVVEDFCICNSFKYLWRHLKKNGLEDLKKADWYLRKVIEWEK